MGPTFMVLLWSRLTSTTSMYKNIIGLTFYFLMRIDVWLFSIPLLILTFTMLLPKMNVLTTRTNVAAPIRNKRLWKARCSGGRRQEEGRRDRPEPAVRRQQLEEPAIQGRGKVQDLEVEFPDAKTRIR